MSTIADGPAPAQQDEGVNVASTRSDAAVSLQRRWDLVLPHRDDMMKIALRRTSSREDAEDVVATALLRTVEHPELDEQRVGAFLCTTVVRLAVDVHRQGIRRTSVGLRAAGRASIEPSLEDIVCDRDEAEWLSAAMDQLPVRERQVLAGRLAGLTLQATSTGLGISQKAAENAYTRVRQRARGLIASTLAVVGVVLGSRRWNGRSAIVAVPVVALAALTLSWGDISGTRSPRETTAVAAEDEERHERKAAHVPRLTDKARASQFTPTARQPAQHTAARSGRTELNVPQIVDRKLVSGGRVYVETRHEESFEDSIRRCLDGLNVMDPLADPCR